MTFLNRTTTPSKNKTFFTKNVKTVTLRTDCSYSQKVEKNPDHRFNSISYSERPCLCTSFFKASVTLEAAIAIPIFLLSMLTIIYVINIMYLQLSLQIALEETARDISKTAYISSTFYSLSIDDQKKASEEDSSLIENIGASVLSVPYIKNCFINEKTTNILNNSFVENGADGISFFLSSVDMSKNIVDIIINYKVTIPFIPNDLLSFNLANRCFMQVYTGKDMSKKQSESSFYVYYTSYGDVFHTNKYCQYLLNYSKAIRYKDALLLYDLNSCQLCCTDTTVEKLRDNNALIYLTSDEQIFHVTLDCQSFTKDVFRIKRTSIDEDELCEQCLKGK